MRVSGCRHLTITGNVIDSYGRNKERQGVWRGLGIDNCQGCQDLGNIVLRDSSIKGVGR